MKAVLSDVGRKAAVKAVLSDVGSPKVLSRASATTEVGRVVAGLDCHGVIRVNSVLQQETAEALLEYVNLSLEQALQSVREYVALDSGDCEPMFFGNVLARQHRHDLKLDLTPQVMEATDQLLGALAPTIASCLGDDAMMYELAALGERIRCRRDSNNPMQVPLPAALTDRRKVPPRC